MAISEWKKTLNDLKEDRERFQMSYEEEYEYVAKFLMNIEKLTVENFQACDSITVLQQTSISRVLLRATLCLEYLQKDWCSAGFFYQNNRRTTNK